MLPCPRTSIVAMGHGTLSQRCGVEKGKWTRVYAAVMQQSTLAGLLLMLTNTNAAVASRPHGAFMNEAVRSRQGGYK